jgi:hypothetical protein
MESNEEREERLAAIHTAAVEQVLRLSRNRYSDFPDAEGQKALITAFEEACDTPEQVKEVGDHLERTLRFAPIPPDIHDAVELLNERKRYNQEPPRPKDSPGGAINLAHDLPPHLQHKFEALARKYKDSARHFEKMKRQAALGFLEEFYKQRPDRRPKEEL